MKYTPDGKEDSALQKSSLYPGVQRCWLVSVPGEQSFLTLDRKG